MSSDASIPVNSSDPVRAVLWDFGGVITSSPFESFNRYEAANGLPKDVIRGLNATNSDTNAWARFERTEVSFDEFCDLFEREAKAAGYVVDARLVMEALDGDVRPEMIVAIERLRAGGLKLAGVTNNVARQSPGQSPGKVDFRPLFDVVIESSVVGVRKPEVRFYEMACEALAVSPRECAFLDDLGVNLKPAAAMGMRTIKVVDPASALAQLEAIVGFALR